MKIFGWHGGWGNFVKVDQQYFGTGEGDSDGWGFYFAQNRSGGEYYCDYARCTKGQGFLHKVSVEITENQLWKDYERDNFRTPNNEIITYSDYKTSITTIGDKKAASILLQKGVSVINNSNGEKPPHGETYIVLAPGLVSICESYEYVKQGGNLVFIRVA